MESGFDKTNIDEDCIEQALLSAFQKSQADLVRYAVANNKDIAESGSTALAVLLKGNKIYGPPTLATADALLVLQKARSFFKQRTTNRSSPKKGHELKLLEERSVMTSPPTASTSKAQMTQDLQWPELLAIWV